MTEHEQSSHHDDVRFEKRDWSSKVVLGSLLTLAIFVGIVYFIVLGTYHLGTWYERTHQTPQNPMARPAEADTRDTNAAVVTSRINQDFSQPRLETNERTENNDFRLQEERKLDSYGWVDQQAGKVRIPIDRAMEIIAQRGLNTTPRTGVTPESVVNTISAAAERADHSEGMASTQPGNESKPKVSKRKGH
ncbi:MAG: hypothetical protein ACRD2U_07530 [Terriglobales bacterium]